MAEYRANVSDFSLKSTWKCTYYIEVKFVGDTTMETYNCSQTTPTTASTTVTFPISLPANAKINSTKVHAVFGSGLTGIALRSVGGKTPSNGWVTLDNPAATATSLAVEFKFKANKDNYESHEGSASTAHQTHNHTSTSTVSEVYLLIDYDVVLTSCGEPTSVRVSPTSAAPGAKLSLSWSGAAAGSGNPITGYQIYRSSSPDSGYSLLTTVSTTSTSGSTTVTAPTTNGAVYYYKVLTLGTYSGYNSGMSSAYASLTCSYEATDAPTSLSLAATNAGPGVAVNLSWTGAAAGTNNPIKGYKVYRADSASDEYTLLDTVTTDSTSGSLSVAAPTTNGESYFYRVQTLGTVDGTDSSLSATYVALTCTYSAPTAPTSLTANGAADLYCLPGTEVTLRWSGASDGANNPITGYTIYQNGQVLVSNLDPSARSYTLTLPEIGGTAYAYSVVAMTSISYSDASPTANVYPYTDPKAPTAITPETKEPVAGSRVKLTWSGAKPGAFNEIIGYNVYRMTSVNGEAVLIESISSTETTASCYVTAHARPTYHYYFRVETVSRYGKSGLSAVYADLVSKEDTGGSSADITVKITPPKPRRKRKFIFGDYDTDLDGQWTVCEWSFEEPEPCTTFVDVPGRLKGPLDMTAAHTDGDTRYGSRTLTVRVESSEGTRMEREGIISRMLNRLHGHRKKITLPDDQTHYAVGRLSVRREYNDMAHASVTITATCEPWRYSNLETTLELEADDNARTAVLVNGGRMIVVPEITITGDNAYVELTANDDITWALTAGTHVLPGLVLHTGYTKLTYTGKGTIAIRYREAIL